MLNNLRLIARWIELVYEVQMRKITSWKPRLVYKSKTVATSCMDVGKVSYVIVERAAEEQD